MTQNRDRVTASRTAVPLRQLQADGTPYFRPKEIEDALAELLRLPTTEVVVRSRIEDVLDPRYVPTECVLYFVRRPGSLNDENNVRDLFVILRQRVLHAVPVFPRRLPGSKKLAEKATDLKIQEAVLDKFQRLLCNDWAGYDERLDFYECRFNSALALLRSTARRDVLKVEHRDAATPYEGDTNEPSRGVEQALANLKNPLNSEGIDFLYRSKLHAAISSLPPDERRVIELVLKDVPIDSQDKDVRTIVKVLGCSEKTVRNRRDRAYARLRDALKEEEDP